MGRNAATMAGDEGPSDSSFSRPLTACDEFTNELRQVKIEKMGQYSIRPKFVERDTIMLIGTDTHTNRTNAPPKDEHGINNTSAICQKQEDRKSLFASFCCSQPSLIETNEVIYENQNCSQELASIAQPNRRVRKSDSKRKLTND